MSKGLKIFGLVAAAIVVATAALVGGIFIGRDQVKQNPAQKDEEPAIVCTHEYPELSEASVGWLKQNLDENIFCAHEISFDVTNNEFISNPYYLVTMSIQCGFNDGSTDTANMKVNLSKLPSETEEEGVEKPIDVDQTIQALAKNNPLTTYTYAFENKLPESLVDSVLTYFIGQYKYNNNVIELTDSKVIMSHTDSTTGEENMVIDNEYKIVRAIDKGFSGAALMRYRRVLILTHDDYGRDQYFTLFAQSDTLSSHKIYVGETESSTASPMYVAFEPVV